MRKLAAISNIAWPAKADDEALDLVAELGFSGVELAPSKVFGPLDAVSADALRAYRARLDARGFAIPALQAILFGVTDVHLFSSADARLRLAERLDRVAVVASELGARACVFGAPTLRDPGELPVEEALTIASDFFAKVAPRFSARGTALAFEANPVIYNCRFIAGTWDALNLVDRVATPGFGLQLDMGTVFANAEGPRAVEAAGRRALHCHISEPHLVPIGTSNADHAAANCALAASGYSGWISVELRTVDDWRGAVKQAAQVLNQYYSA